LQRAWYFHVLVGSEDRSPRNPVALLISREIRV
jgi:hypothetical protein